MHSFGPLYLRAADYLARYELGLAPSRDALTAREEQAILFVAAERQSAYRRQPTNPEFAARAAPEEQDVSDEELLGLVHRGRR